jgi:hypothetical protein
VEGGGLLVLPWVSRCCFKEPDSVPIHLAALFAALDETITENRYEWKKKNGKPLKIFETKGKP